MDCVGVYCCSVDLEKGCHALLNVVGVRHPIPGVHHVRKAAVRTSNPVVEEEEEGLPFLPLAFPLCGLSQNSYSREYRDKLRKLLWWMLPPWWLGLVQEIHDGDCACRGVVHFLGGIAVDRCPGFVQQPRDVFDEVVV